MQSHHIWAFFLSISIFTQGCGSPEAHSSLQQIAENPLSYLDYKVRFTNPVCAHYPYSEEVRAVNGEKLTQKPKNVYCKQSDATASESRKSSPYRNIKDWLEDESTRSVFATFLSFSHNKTRNLLCASLQRGVDVTLILDSGTRLRAAESLAECTGENSGTLVFHTRGGQQGLGYAHNKLLMINAEDDITKIAFGSANLSSGVGLHHENWHFVTVPSNTYFVQSHICLRDGMLYHGASKREYRSFIKACRADIPFAMESDIRNFFVPAEGDQALAAIETQLQQTQSLDMAMHRFSSKELIALLQDREERASLPIRMIADDDLYWASQGRTVGPNNRGEFYRIRGFLQRGAQIRYMETNHNSRLLHHNKFMIFRGDTVNAVFTGAGNFTSTAFNENFENFYMITIPYVKQRFAWQFSHMWNHLATAPENLPEDHVMP